MKSCFIFRMFLLYENDVRGPVAVTGPGSMPLPYPVKKSKIIKITITKLNKLKLELQSKKWNKIRITKFKKLY